MARLSEQEIKKALHDFAVARSVLTKTESAAFFGGLVWALRPRIDQDGEIPSVGVDQAGNVYINPRWWNKLSPQEQVGVLCHEVCHPAFRSWQRIGNRDPELWNVAHDVWINRLLELNGLNIPFASSGAATWYTLRDKGIVLEDDFIERKTTEDIYAMIEEKAKKVIIQITSQNPMANDMQDGDGGGPGDGDKQDEASGGEDGGGFSSSKDEIDWDSLVIGAMATAQEKGVGNFPGSMKRRLGMEDPVVPWQQLVYQFFMRVTQGMRYTFKPPQRRHLYRGITLPRGEPAYPHVAFAVDVSGSMFEFMDYMLGEIHGCQQATRASILFLAGDTELTHEIEIEPGDPYPDEIGGWGGTRFTWAFERIQEIGDHTLSGIVFLTDGYNFDTIPEEVYPDVETLWIIYGDNENFKPPFGSVVFVSYQELRRAMRGK